MLKQNQSCNYECILEVNPRGVIMNFLIMFPSFKYNLGCSPSQDSSGK